jgi:hypothetical protein
MANGLVDQGSRPQKVASKAIEQGLANDSRGDQSKAGGFPPHLLSRADKARVIETIWDLIIEGVLRPGNNELEMSLPHLHLTTYGKEVLTNGPATPHDPDKYLNRVRERIGEIDPVIETYLLESTKTFRIGCLLSSMVALGCASEKALELAMEAYAQACEPAKATAFRKKIEGKAISTQFDAFRAAVDSLHGNALPRKVKDGLKIAMLFVFESIRQHRNDAGHPTGLSVNRESAHAHLAVFPNYLTKMHELTAWFKSQTPGSLT